MNMRPKFILNTSFRDAFFFWISIAGVSLFAGFVGGGMRSVQVPQTIETVVPQPQTIVLQERTDDREGQQNIDSVVSSIRQSMFSLYAWKPNKQALYALSSAPVASQFLSFALAVTSDGWLVTVSDVNQKLTALSAIGADGEIFSVERIVADASAGYLFVKINAKNLKAIEFPSLNDFSATEDGYIISNHTTISRISVSPPQYAAHATVRDTLIRSTSLRDKLHNPDATFASLCMPVVRNERVVLGCTLKKGIRSFRYLKRSMSELLRKGDIRRVAFDIPYIDLSYTPAPLHPLYRDGALVIFDQSNKKNVIQSGDIILSVNNERIDRNRNLSELIGQYSPGDILELLVARKNSEQKITLTLN